jgi:hypothetical protein
LSYLSTLRAGTAEVGGFAKALHGSAAVANTAALTNSGVELARNWKNLTPEEQIKQSAQLTLWGALAVHGARNMGKKSGGPKQEEEGIYKTGTTEELMNDINKAAPNTTTSGNGREHAQSQGKNDSTSESPHLGTGYDRVYSHAGKKPRGMSENLDQIRQKHGDRGVMTVTETQKKQDEIFKSGAGDKTRGPVVAGITGPRDTAPHFGQNFTRQELRDGADKKFFADVHPILRNRLEAHQAKLDAKTVKVEDEISLTKAGTPEEHAEIRALDSALKAYETRNKTKVTEDDLPKFMLHNRSLRKEKDGTYKPDGSANKVEQKDGVPPRCVHCWYLTDGVTVIGND